MPHDILFIAAENLTEGVQHGKFAKKVLVILPDSQHLSAEKIFLEKIMLAVQLHLENDTLCWTVLPHQKISVATAARQLGAEKVLIFGMTPAAVGMALQLSFYQKVDWAGVQYLFSESLSMLENDRDRKAKLWTALKSLFL